MSAGNLFQSHLPLDQLKRLEATAPCSLVQVILGVIGEASAADKSFLIANQVPEALLKSVNVDSYSSHLEVLSVLCTFESDPECPRPSSAHALDQIVKFMSDSIDRGEERKLKLCVELLSELVLSIEHRVLSCYENLLALAMKGLVHSLPSVRTSR